MKGTLTTLAGTALLCFAALSVAQSASERDRLEERLADLRSQQAEVEAELRTIDDAERGRLADVPPELREQFERARAEDPARADRWRKRHGRRLAELEELREKDPEAYRSKIETMQALRRSSELATEIVQLEDAGKLDEANGVREDLRREGEFIFERMLDQRRADIEKLEARLAEAKERLEEMEAKGPEKLDERIEFAIDRARDRLNGDRDGDRERPHRRRR